MKFPVKLIMGMAGSYFYLLQYLLQIIPYRPYSVPWHRNLLFIAVTAAAGVSVDAVYIAEHRSYDGAAV